MTTPSPVIPPPQLSDGDDVDLNSIVAYNFRAARTLRGWTQKETGRRLEPLLGRRVPQVHVAQLEGAYRGRRRREFDAHELLAFAITFQLPVVWFLLPPPGDDRRLRHTDAHAQDLYEIVFGRPDQLEPLYQRPRRLAHSDPHAAENAVDQLAGPGVTAQIPAHRQRRTEMVLALLDSRTDRLERAAGEIGAFFDQVRLGIRSLITQAERTTDAWPEPDPPALGLKAPRLRPPDAQSRRPQEGYDFSDWDQGLLDELSDELDHHNIAHEWDDALLSVYAADTHRVDDVLDRFVAAREAHGQRLPNPFGGPDG